LDNNLLCWLDTGLLPWDDAEGFLEFALELLELGDLGSIEDPFSMD